MGAAETKRSYTDPDSNVTSVTAHTTDGNGYLLTSYATNSTTTIVNQVQDAFNGLGQLITATRAGGEVVSIPD